MNPGCTYIWVLCRVENPASCQLHADLSACIRCGPHAQQRYLLAMNPGQHEEVWTVVIVSVLRHLIEQICARAFPAVLTSKSGHAAFPNPNRSRFRRALPAAPFHGIRDARLVKPPGPRQRDRTPLSHLPTHEKENNRRGGSRTGPSTRNSDLLEVRRPAGAWTRREEPRAEKLQAWQFIRKASCWLRSC